MPPRFSVKVLQQFVTDVVIFHMVKGDQQWYIIRYYLSPDDASTIKCFLMDVVKLPRWSELLVAGNFNADITGPEGAEQDR